MKTIELPRTGMPILRFDGDPIATVANKHHRIAVYRVAATDAEVRGGVNQDRTRKRTNEGYAASIEYLGTPAFSWASMFKRRDSCEEWILNHRTPTYAPADLHVADLFDVLVEKLWVKWDQVDSPPVVGIKG